MYVACLLLVLGCVHPIHGVSPTTPDTGVLHTFKYPVRYVKGREGVLVRVPSVVYGTAWKKNLTAGFVFAAITHGFRAIDTANQPKHYNETAVGEGLRFGIDGGFVKREDMFLQTKFTPLNGQIDDESLPYSRNATLTIQVHESVTTSLEHLQTTYLDSLVLHEQMENETDMLEVWRAMEQEYDAGRVRLLGISNVNLHRLRNLLREARIKPTFVQNRCLAKDDWDKGIRELCLEHAMMYQGFWLVTGNRHVLTNSQVMAAAAWHKKTPAQLLLRFVVQAGMMVLTGPKIATYMAQNLDLDFDLSAPEMDAMRQMRTTAVDASTKVTAKFWNMLHFTVEVFWKSPTGEETLSYTLQGGQTESDAENYVALTFHTHTYVFRVQATGELFSSWKADAGLGSDQIVVIDHSIDLTLSNLRAEPVAVFYRDHSGDTLVEGGELVANDGTPLGSPQVRLKAYDDHMFVIKSEAGVVLDTKVVRTAEGGNRQHHYFNKLSEHTGEL
eukprot:m.127884 g.127884  ORF g.127884 m.127884 type:complete len:500 (+) comp29303_c0_seq2:233-1732(+)